MESWFPRRPRTVDAGSGGSRCQSRRNRCEGQPESERLNPDWISTPLQVIAAEGCSLASALT